MSRRPANKILVTGGAGYIGSHTVVELINSGYTPVIVDNFTNSDKKSIERIEKLVQQPVKYYPTDYQNSHAVSKIIKTEAVDAVIHFAAHKFVGESVEKPLMYYNDNVGGFIGLLQILKDTGVGRLVLSSSAAVYGNPSEDMVTEQTLCQPESPYGWSKYMDEIILRDSCKAIPNLKAVALRYFNVVGAHDSGLIGEVPTKTPQNLLPIIVRVLTGEMSNLTVFGDDYPTSDGTCLRDYIHVVDLAKAHVAALKKIESQKSGSYDVFNIGTGKPTSVLELIKTFEKVNKIKVPYAIGQRRPGDPVAYYADVKKANLELGWQAQRSIRDAVRDAWRWQKMVSDRKI